MSARCLLIILHHYLRQALIYHSDYSNYLFYLALTVLYGKARLLYGPEEPLTEGLALTELLVKIHVQLCVPGVPRLEDLGGQLSRLIVLIKLLIVSFDLSGHLQLLLARHWARLLRSVKLCHCAHVQVRWCALRW